MGLLGNTINGVLDAGREVVDSVTGIPRAVGDTLDGVGDAVTGTEDNVNEGAQDTTNEVGESVEQGSDAVFDLGKDGFDAAEGFLNWLAGIGETIQGLGKWLRRNGDIIPLAGDSIELVGSILTGIGGVIAGLFHSFAGGFAVLEGIAAWGASLGPWEGIGAFLAFVLLILAGYMLISSFGLQAFPSFLTAGMGAGLLIWTQNNVTGAALIALIGIVLITLGMVTDRQSWLVFGILFYLPGVPMFLAALKFGFIAIFLITMAALVVLTMGLSYLETDVAPGLALDEARGPGLIDGPKKAKNAAKKATSGARQAAARAKGGGA